MAGDDGVPGKGWYWAAALIAGASTAAVVALIAWLAVSFDSNQQFLVPGRHTVELAAAGEYVVWNDHRTVFEGRTYDESEKLPAGIQIAVVDVASGKPLEVASTSGSTMTSGTTERASFARFTIEKPGRYEITVSGEFEPRVFSTGKDMVLLLVGVIFGSFALLLGSYGAAAGIAIWAYIKRDLRAKA